MYNGIDSRDGKAVICLAYRPFWWSFFHPRATGLLIVVILFLVLNAVLNTFAAVGAISRGAASEAAGSLAAVALYAAPAYGLAKLKRWARMFEICFSIVMVVLGFITMLAASLIMGVFIVATHGLVGIYLLSERCRKVFYPPDDVEEEKSQS